MSIASASAPVTSKSKDKNCRARVVLVALAVVFPPSSTPPFVAYPLKKVFLVEGGQTLNRAYGTENLFVPYQLPHVALGFWLFHVFGYYRKQHPHTSEPRPLTAWGHCSSFSDIWGSRLSVVVANQRLTRCVSRGCSDRPQTHNPTPPPTTL